MNEEGQHAPQNKGSEEPSPPEALIKGDVGIEAAQVWIAAFLIVIAAVVAYSNAFGLPFHRDDQTLIVRNTALHSLPDFPEALSGEHPRALSMFSIGATWWALGDSIFFYRFVNILLHALNGALVFLVARRLIGPKTPEPVAMLAGLAFALHPLTTSSVNMVVERSQAMGAAFALLAILAFMRSIDGHGKIDWRWTGFSVLFYFLAWTSDMAYWGLPIIVCGIAWVVGQGRMRWMAQAPLFALLGVLVCVQFATGMWPLEGLLDRLGAQSRLMAEHVQRLILPMGQSVFHAPPDGVSAVPWLWGVGLIASTVVMRFVPMLGLAGFWVTVSLGASALAYPAEELNGEPRLYFAVAGIAFVLPWVVSAVKSGVPRTVIAGAAAAGVLALGVLTFLRNQDWQDELALWSLAEAQYPKSGEVNETLGRIHLELGEEALGVLRADSAAVPGSQRTAAEEAATAHLETALERLSRSLESAPAAELYALTGRVHEYLGRTDDAIVHYGQALRLDVDNQAYTLRMAALYERRAQERSEPSNITKAVDYYERALELGPIPARAAERVAGLYFALGRVADAGAVLSRLPEAEQPSAMRQAAMNSLDQIGGLERKAFQLVQEQAPAKEIAGEMARSYILRGNYQRAFYTLADLHERGQGDPLTWSFLGVCKAMMKDPQGFLDEWPQPPGTPEEQHWIHLAQTCATLNQWDAAELYLESPEAAVSVQSFPLLVLGGIAASMNQGARAEQYFQQATDTYPGLPDPWMALADLAVMRRDRDAALRYLNAAEQRGADEAALAERRQRLGAPAVEEDAPRSIIR